MVVLLGQKRWLPLEHSLQASDDEDQDEEASEQDWRLDTYGMKRRSA